MKKWIKTSEGQTETYLNTTAITSIEYHKQEKYMRIKLTDGSTVLWRPLTADTDSQIEMERFYADFIREINN